MNGDFNFNDWICGAKSTYIFTTESRGKTVNLIKGILKSSVIILTASALAISTSQIASAAPAHQNTVSSVSANVKANKTVTPTAADKAMAAEILAVAPGETLAIPATTTSPALTVTRSSAGVLSVSMGGSEVVSAYGWCTYSVTAALFALGAGVVAILALSGSGFVVAGVFLSSSELGMLAGAMGSWSAVYSIVAIYVC